MRESSELVSGRARFLRFGISFEMNRGKQVDAGQAQNRESVSDDWLVADGEMSRVIRSKDWSQTAVGPPEDWPLSLRTALGIMLHSRYQMFVWWGKELIYF
jgi:hypothetical protein